MKISRNLVIVTIIALIIMDFAQLTQLTFIQFFGLNMTMLLMTLIGTVVGGELAPFYYEAFIPAVSTFLYIIALSVVMVINFNLVTLALTALVSVVFIVSLTKVIAYVRA